MYGRKERRRGRREERRPREIGIQERREGGGRKGGKERGRERGRKERREGGSSMNWEGRR